MRDVAAQIDWGADCIKYLTNYLKKNAFDFINQICFKSNFLKNEKKYENFLPEIFCRKFYKQQFYLCGKLLSDVAFSRKIQKN